jgi:hypothetical protein
MKLFGVEIPLYEFTDVPFFVLHQGNAQVGPPEEPLRYLTTFQVTLSDNYAEAMRNTWTAKDAKGVLLDHRYPGARVLRVQLMLGVRIVDHRNGTYATAARVTVLLPPGPMHSTWCIRLPGKGGIRGARGTQINFVPDFHDTATGHVRVLEELTNLDPGPEDA